MTEYWEILHAGIVGQCSCVSDWLRQTPLSHVSFKLSATSTVCKVRVAPSLGSWHCPKPRVTKIFCKKHNIYESL